MVVLRLFIKATTSRTNLHLHHLPWCYTGIILRAITPWCIGTYCLRLLHNNRVRDYQLLVRDTPYALLVFDRIWIARGCIHNELIVIDVQDWLRTWSVDHLRPSRVVCLACVLVHLLLRLMLLNNPHNLRLVDRELLFGIVVYLENGCLNCTNAALDRVDMLKARFGQFFLAICQFLLWWPLFLEVYLAVHCKVLGAYASCCVMAADVACRANLKIALVGLERAIAIILTC